MKYKLIKETDKIRLLNSKLYIYYDRLTNLHGSQSESKAIKTSIGLISTKILTDGQIKSVTDLDSNEFVLPSHMDKVEADVYEAKDLELINHSYVIRVLTELECRKLNKSAGLFEVIKDVEVYIKDENDKEALRNIKKTLKLIYGQKNKSNNQDITYEKTDLSVYQLVK